MQCNLRAISVQSPCILVQSHRPAISFNLPPSPKSTRNGRSRIAATPLLSIINPVLEISTGCKTEPEGRQPVRITRLYCIECSPLMVAHGYYYLRLVYRLYVVRGIDRLQSVSHASLNCIELQRSLGYTTATYELQLVSRLEVQTLRISISGVSTAALTAASSPSLLCNVTVRTPSILSASIASIFLCRSRSATEYSRFASMKKRPASEQRRVSRGG